MSANTNTSAADLARFEADRAHLPGPVYILFMLLVFALGLGALWVNREHAYANLTLLRLPEEALFVRQRSIDLFAAAHLVLFFLVAILPRERFGSLRLRMGAVALAVVAFETAGMWQSRFGIALSGQAATAADARRIQDLEADIAEARKNADGLRESARGQAKSQFKDSRAAGLSALEKATQSTDRANSLSAELAALRANKAPAEADIWKDWMPYKAAAEAILVTLLSMVCFATAGNMGRAARDVYLTSRPAKAGKSAPAELPRWSVAMPQTGRAAAGLGAAGAAAGAHAMPVYAPPLPSEPAVVAQATYSPGAGALGVTEKMHPGASKSLHPGASESMQQPPTAAPDAPPKKTSRKAGQGTSKPRKASDGLQRDTGTGGDAGHRYSRIRADVEAGTLKPGLRAFVRQGMGQETAKRYLAQLHADGVIKPEGRGWALSAKV